MALAVVGTEPLGLHPSAGRTSTSGTSTSKKAPPQGER